MKGRTHWDDLYKNTTYFIKILRKEFILQESWANKSDEKNEFDFHTHKRDITVVYYAKNNYPVFGTNIDEQVIIWS